MKQRLKNKPLVLNLHIRDNNQNNQNKNPQNKKPLLIFFKILILLKNNHYTHHYHKSQIYNNQILLKQIQFTIHQNSLKKRYKIHEVLQFTDDSNLIIIPTHNITQNEFTNQNQDNTSNTNPDNTSVLSTSNTNITQPSQTQVPFPRNYNPPSVPPQFSTQINTHDSPQQSSSNTHYLAQSTNTVHFQTPIQPSPSEIQTSTYTPAQTNPVQTTQSTLNINTIHSNPSSNYTTARHLSLSTSITNYIN